jgi:hypothetical protein
VAVHKVAGGGSGEWGRSEHVRGEYTDRGVRYGAAVDSVSIHGGWCECEWAATQSGSGIADFNILCEDAANAVVVRTGS